MPAYRAALGLAPTARNSKPVLVRKSSHQMNAAAPSARNSPRCTFIAGSSQASSAGSWALSSTVLEIGSLRPSRWNSVVFRR